MCDIHYACVALTLPSLLLEAKVIMQFHETEIGICLHKLEINSGQCFEFSYFANRVLPSIHLKTLKTVVKQSQLHYDSKNHI